jgi:hypothetical protein
VSFIGRSRSQRTTTSQQLVARDAVHRLRIPDNADPAQVESVEPVESVKPVDGAPAHGRPQPVRRGR